jgi:PPM family protein phosphatase
MGVDGNGDMNIEPVEQRRFAYSWGAVSDRGLLRAENEDSYFIQPEIPLFVVSDGMGGHRGGELASKIVVEDLPVMIEARLGGLRSVSPRSVKRMLLKAVMDQNRQLHMEGAEGDGFEDMGATVVLLLFAGGLGYVANLGDSRCYRLRKGRLRQLSEDHSVTAHLVRKGRLAAEKADEHPTAGMLTGYMGMPQKAQCHVHGFSLEKGDLFVLCSDGLTDMLSEQQIEAVLRDKGLDCQGKADRLAEQANSAGGHDNITVVTVLY